MAAPHPQPVPIPIHGQSIPQGHAQTGPVQYVILNTGPKNTAQRPVVKVEYSEKNIPSVRWLTNAQLVLGIVLLIFQVITTAFNDEFINELSSVKSTFDRFFDYVEVLYMDHAATGVWFGILVIVSAVVGIHGCKRQKKGLIIAHLVLNVLILLCVFAPISTLSTTISNLNFCRKFGESYDTYYYHQSNYRYDNYYGTRYPTYSIRTTTTTTTTTTPEPPKLYGETLKGLQGDFYCKHAMFRVWLALDAVSLVCTVLILVLTLTLLVYNSIAACRCCRQTGCCGKCCGISCCCYGSTINDVPLPVVSYYSQPSAAAATPVAQPQLVPHPQFTSQLYAQRPMMYNGQVTMMPAGVPYGQPVMGVPSITTQMATPAAVSQAPAGADAAGEKWEDLPPDYAAIYQNQSNQGNR